MVQENRSFDDLFATFPGADGALKGRIKGKRKRRDIPLHMANLAEPCDFGEPVVGHRAKAPCATGPQSLGGQ